MKYACLFHIKGTTSLIICYPLRVPVHERCLTPAFASCRRRQWPEILQYRIFWTTFVVYHPNYYFSSQLGHAERKAVACKLKAATSWLHKKSILIEEYYTASKPAKSQNKNKARQVGSTSWLRWGNVEQWLRSMLKIHGTLYVRSR